MFPTPHRSKGGAPLIGAAAPGQSGPFGEFGAGQLPYEVDLDDGGGREQHLDDDGGRDAVLLAAVAEAAARRTAERVARFRQRRAEAQQRREAMWQARQAGVAQRHSGKLRALADGQDDDTDERTDQ